MNSLTPAELSEIVNPKIKPTPEQSKVISLDKDGVHLVLAGAGSGKTETMAARVVWLAVNDNISPERILGLTFTRKAAQELSERFRQRIAQVRSNQKALRAAGYHLDWLPKDVPDYGFATPTVSTYNSFAASIFTEHAALIGWNSDAIVITDATAYGIARGIVERSDDKRLAELDKSLDGIVPLVKKLADALAEYGQVENDAVIEFAQSFREISERPPASKFESQKKYRDVANLELLIPLARDFIAEKRRLEVVEFSDQVVLAKQIITQNPEVREFYQARFDAVILDEYQDTSYPQTSLFSEMFGSSRITAVGDPNQSIYGWRGASPENVSGYFDAFGAPAEGNTHTLTESRRNGHQILKAANTLLEYRGDDESHPRQVATLVANEDATDNPIMAIYTENDAEEAAALATWFKKQRETKVLDPIKKIERKQTLAMLIRSRTNLRTYLNAFDELEIPYRVLGVTGVLESPFIADLHCVLTVAAKPNAGVELVRLLGGARWRIGVDDLWSLRNYSRNIATAFLSKPERDGFNASQVPEEAASLVDALDSLRYTKRVDVEIENTDGQDSGKQRVKFSDEGWEQLVSAANFLNEIRKRAHLPLPHIVRFASEAMQFEQEAWAVTTESRNPASYREAYDDLVISYLNIPAGNSNGGMADRSLAGFIDWLLEVEKRDRETPRQEPPEPGTVQVLTIHGAKGLEWDSVALPNWTERDKGRATVSANDLGWLRPGALPGVFRADEIVRFPVAIDTINELSNEELEEASKEYTARLRKELYLPEERRAFYVAVTRARHYLWVSGSYFQGDNKNLKEPNKYWNELVEAGLIDPSVMSAKPEKKSEKAKVQITWPPADPLGSAENRAAHEAAAEMVRTASGKISEADATLIENLIANRVAETSSIPVRIPASSYAEWSIDLNRVKETSRRPVPVRPYRAARIGTEVHAWIERRGYDDGMFDIGLDFDTDSETLSNDRVEELKQKFAKSRWAKTEPVYNEIEILLPQGQHVVVCKIDAVYKIDGRWAVVDWKTGAMPATENEKDQKAMQLVLYRRAFANWMGIEPDEVDAVLFYVAHETEWAIEPERLARLEALPAIES